MFHIPRETVNPKDESQTIVTQGETALVFSAREDTEVRGDS